MLQNSSQSTVEALVRSASRRRHTLLALDELSTALTIVLGGVILLLLLGTQILDWYWLVMLGVIGAAIAGVRLRRRRLSCYRVAQVLDRRLQLSDTLSTAWFVLTAPPSAGTQRRMQLAQAERLASSIQPKAVFRFEGGRTWTVNASLLVIAFALFGIRYFAYGQLNFQPVLLPIRFSGVVEQFETRLEHGNKNRLESYAPKKSSNPRLENGPTLPESQTNRGSNSPARPEEGESNHDGDNAGARQQLTPQSHDNAQEQNAKQEAQSRDNPSKESDSPTRKSGPQQPQLNDSANKNGSEPAAQGSPEGQSLTSKLRDALSGLLAKMEGGSSSQPPSGQLNQRSNSSGGKNQTASSKGQQSNSESAANQQSEASSLPAQQQAHSAESSAASRSDASGDSSGHRSSDSRSAAGHQNGSKATREAEQLKAMGKLAEIIGKRSASVTGQMTVETPSGKQQLQTGYTNKLGHHSGIGSDIEHDNVPMEDQQYIREYMKQVHSQGTVQ